MTKEGVEIEGIEEFYNLLDGLVPTREESAEIAAAGALVFSEGLKKNTPYRQEVASKHLRDDITFKKNQYANGSTDVGFITSDRGGKSYIARLLNDGFMNVVHGQVNKYVPGTHFIEQTIAEYGDLVISEQIKVYKKMKGIN